MSSRKSGLNNGKSTRFVEIANVVRRVGFKPRPIQQQRHVGMPIVNVQLNCSRPLKAVVPLTFKAVVPLLSEWEWKLSDGLTSVKTWR